MAAADPTPSARACVIDGRQGWRPHVHLPAPSGRAPEGLLWYLWNLMHAHMGAGFLSSLRFPLAWRLFCDFCVVIRHLPGQGLLLSYFLTQVSSSPRIARGPASRAE